MITWSVCFSFLPDVKIITHEKEKLQILKQLETQWGELQNTYNNIFNIFCTTLPHFKVGVWYQVAMCKLVKVNKQDRDYKIFRKWERTGVKASCTSQSRRKERLKRHMKIGEGTEPTHHSRRMETRNNAQLPSQRRRTSLGGGMTEWMISDAA